MISDWTSTTTQFYTNPDNLAKIDSVDFEKTGPTGR